MSQTPSVGRVVHYVSYGTPGGEYTKQCRAAVITEVGQWVTTGMTSYPSAQARQSRTLTQVYDPEAVALFVMNPAGVFLNGAGPVACQHQEPDGVTVPAGGTWHWPERTDGPAA